MEKEKLHVYTETEIPAQLKKLGLMPGI